MNLGTTSHLEGLAVSTRAMTVPSVKPTRMAKKEISRVSKKPCKSDSMYSGVLNNSMILVKKSLIGKPHVFNNEAVDFGNAFGIFFGHFGEDFIEGFKKFGALFVDGDGVGFFNWIIFFYGFALVIKWGGSEVGVFANNEFGGELVGNGVVDDM